MAVRYVVATQLVYQKLIAAAPPSATQGFDPAATAGTTSTSQAAARGTPEAQVGVAQGSISGSSEGYDPAAGAGLRRRLSRKLANVWGAGECGSRWW
jgi:hypothetical protein